MDQFESMINNLNSDMKERYVKQEELIEFRQKLQQEKFQIYEDNFKEQDNKISLLKD